MKITKSKLRQIIQEELCLLSEQSTLASAVESLGDAMELIAQAVMPKYPSDSAEGIAETESVIQGELSGFIGVLEDQAAARPTGDRYHVIDETNGTVLTMDEDLIGNHFPAYNSEDVSKNGLSRKDAMSLIDKLNYEFVYDESDGDPDPGSIVAKAKSKEDQQPSVGMPFPEVDPDLMAKITSAYDAAKRAKPFGE